MAFALLCFSVIGAPPGPLTMWEQSLCNIVHHVKTAHGVTDASYQYSLTSPIIGPCQGSRAATSPLCKAMNSLGRGVHFCDPAQQIQYFCTINMCIANAANATNDFLSWLHPPPLNPSKSLKCFVTMHRPGNALFVGPLVAC
jgi:hypothetical protein